MEDQALVEALLHERAEVLDVTRGIRRKELNDHVAVSGRDPRSPLEARAHLGALEGLAEVLLAGLDAALELADLGVDHGSREGIRAE